MDQSLGAVAAPRQEAVAAGEVVLDAGGNSVDAAVAVAAVLAVVEPYMTGPGALIEVVSLDSEGRCVVIDGAAHAPRGATADMFRVVGPASRADYAWPEVEDAANILGGRSVAAPRWSTGLWALHQRLGRLPWADLFAPAIQLARDGFRVDYFSAAVVAREMGTLRQDPEAAGLYYPTGLPLRPPIDGPETRVVNPGLATTLEAIAQEGPRALAEGPIADAIIRTVRDRGGVLHHDDLSDANVESAIGSVRPLARFRDHDILVSPRPSGGVTVAQILGILDALGPPVVSATSVERYLRFARASIVAFGSRLTTMSGSDDERTLAGLLSPDRLHATAAFLDVEMNRPDAPSAGHHPSTATTCLAIADGEGGIVALTTTLLSFFGSQVGVKDCGFHLNNAMLYFDPRPGAPNSILPGKRALAAVAPLIAVSSDGSRRTAIAGLGARRIITATAQAVENRIEHRLELQEAIDLPRVHVDTVEALVDERLPSEVADAIERLGWPVRREHYGPTTAGMARLMAVETDSVTRTSTAAIDRRSQATWRFGEG